MSAAKLADRIRMNRKSRSPVQDTVHKLFDEIAEAMAGGGSFRTIHAQLTREGHNVGKAHNSLFTAFKVVKKRREQSAESMPASGKATAQRAAANASTMSSDAVPSGQLPAAVVDTRRKTNEW